MFKRKRKEGGRERKFGDDESVEKRLDFLERPSCIEREEEGGGGGVYTLICGRRAQVVAFVGDGSVEERKGRGEGRV